MSEMASSASAQLKHSAAAADQDGAAAAAGFSPETPSAAAVTRARPDSAGYPKVQGRCPACGNTTLFLGADGYVTCGWIGGREERGCPDPLAANRILVDRRSVASQALAEFHEHPNALEEDGTNSMRLRATLHREEHKELQHELDQANAGHASFWQIARELADVVYVAYGTAWAYNIDLDAALREVHRAAMDKMDAGLRREDGKILKPPGFRPPDMSEAITGSCVALRKGVSFDGP